MADRSSTETRSPVDADLRVFRERVAASLALFVMVGALVMMVVAVTNIESQQFDRVKDLLLFINPLIGVVIGYYFNKVSTEARAETAEHTAHDAMAAAQQAETGRREASAEAVANWNRMQQARLALDEVTEAAEGMLEDERPAGPGTLGGDGPPRSRPEAHFALRAAVNRARRVGDELRLEGIGIVPEPVRSASGASASGGGHGTQ